MVEYVYESFDPEMEVHGTLVVGLVTGAARTMGEVDSLLEKHGLGTLDPNAWYRVQNILDFYADVSEQGTGMFDLVALGMHAAKTFEFPPEMQTLEDYFPTQHATYSQTHRGTEVGEWHYEKVSERHYRIVMRTPWPPDVMYGALYGVCQHFLGEAKFRVTRTELAEYRQVLDIEWSE